MYHPYMFRKDKRNSIFYKNQVHFVDTLSRRKYFGYRSPMYIRKQPQRLSKKPRRRKLLRTITLPLFKAPLKKFSSESIRAIARNPNIDLQSIGIYSKPDLQHHFCTQQF